MVADFQSAYPRETFWQSKRLSLDGSLDFSCEASAKKIIGQDIINSNAGSFLVSDRAKRLIDSFVPPNTLQFLPSVLRCSDERLIELYLINTLHQEKIINIEESEKLKIGPSDNDFILLDRGLKILPSALKEKKIGRNYPSPYNTEIFLHNDLVKIIKENNMNRCIIFD